MSIISAVHEEGNSNVEEEESTRIRTMDGRSRAGSSVATATNSGDPIQLYRPANTCEQVEQLLVRTDLVEPDIAAFLSGGNLPANDDLNEDVVRTKMRSDFHQRRSEIRGLSEQLKSGEARIDEDGRLVPTEPPRPPRANLPPPPPPRRNNNDNMFEQLLQADAQAMNGNPGGGAIFPEELGNEEGGGANLTFRRICFAVLAVVTAFVCVILQTLPLMQYSEAVDPNFDQLLHELLHVKFLKEHLRYCPQLDRQPPPLPPFNMKTVRSYRFWQERVWQALGLFSGANCDDGVVHIPAKHVISNSILHSSLEEAALLEPFHHGVDKIWNIPCYNPPNFESKIGGEVTTPISRCYPGWNSSSHPHKIDAQKECPNTDSATSPTSHCFRGVHDDVISKYEVDQTLRLGNSLILNGGDHFDVHYDVSHLNQRIPSVVTKLERLLHERYNQSQFQPVAFRVQTAGPMDFYGVNLFQTSALTLNQTTYLDWVERSKRRNEQALYSLPWPFRVPPVRDTCHLLADLEADPRFAIHTSVFLGDGAGMEYRGGVALYADNHRSNYKQPKHKIRRGLTIDGSKGRVVVSSGGIENRRCRLPIRAGLRTVLQIWWDCSQASSGG